MISKLTKLKQTVYFLTSNDVLSSLIELLILPLWVLFHKDLTQAVVLPQHDGVHHKQAWICKKKIYTLSRKKII